MIPAARRLLLVSLASLSGCAPPAAAILPQYVSTRDYAGFSCRELEIEQGRLDTDLFIAASSQDETRFEDTIGMVDFFPLPVPIASLQGLNFAPQVALAKGRLNAVQDAIVLHGCDLRRITNVAEHDDPDPPGR